MMIILLILMRSKCQDLYYESFTTSTFTTDEGKSLQQQGWNLKGQYGIYSDCGPTRLFGGYQNFANGTSITLLKQLPPHYSIKISVQFWKIDSWDDEHFYLFIDNQQAFSGTYDVSGIPRCGLTNWDDRIVQIDREQLHTYQSVLILMTTDLDTFDEFWGIRNFKLYIYPCPAGCQICDSGNTRVDCIVWIVIDSSLLDADLDQLVIDGWEIKNGCQQKSYCASMPILGGQGCFGKGTILTRRLNLPPHDKLKLKLRYIFIDTWENEFTQILIDDTIISTFPYNYANQVIRNLCGQIFNEKNQLLELTISHTSSQATLKIINNLDQGLINESFGIRDFQIFIACVFGDSFNQACGVICGNGIKEGFEQCDDGNIYPYDGCFNCEYSCVEGCSHCVFGVCFECEDFYEIQPYFNTCTPNLMDKKISLWETCDDELNYLTCKDGKFFCPYNCQFCIFGQCQICIENYELINNQCEPICQEQFFTNDIECQDFNLFAFDQCHQCSFELEEGCSLHSHGQCIQCQEGWEFDEEQSKCRPICGDFNIRGDEQCDYYQIKSYKQVYRCEFCKYTCQPECIDCQFGMCYECSTGWEIRNFKCETICNDNLINGLEDCDDSNTIKFDGCHQCHNDCQQECSYCYRGICLECIFGWRLTQEFKCQSNCGDGLVALISIEQCDDSNLIQFDGCHLCQLEQFCGDGIVSIPEQCDDMNEIPYDGCFQCLYQCELDCKFCNQGVCQIDCEAGYQFIDNQCQEICGNGIVTISEQCDDMNQTPYDGCFQCFYQCELDCEFCNEGICQKDCEHGYQFIGNQCQEVCGDGIVTNSEQCDDMNDIPYDGCYKCEIECSNNCQLCQQGQCILCNESYALSQMENQCKSICGDGILKDDEECDDKNFIDNDGCSKNCKIEQDFVCKNFEYTFTLCTYKQYPKFQATLLNQISFNSQYVKLNFDQLVKTKLNGSFIDQIQANILDLNLESYQINILSLQDASQTLSQVEYIVEILFKTQLTHIPILEVKLLDQLYNEYDSPLINQYLTIRLLQSKYLDEQELQSAIHVKDSAYYALMIIGGSGFVLFLSGSSFFISAILEILQQQSYLRFINVVFPLNLFTYFELSNLLSLQPILDKVWYNFFSISVIGENFVESYEKFYYYQINANIFINIQAQIFQILIILLTYIFVKMLFKILRQMKDNHYFCFGYYVANFILRAFKILFKKNKEFLKDSFQLFIRSNSWDLLFLSFLQIKSPTDTQNMYIFAQMISYWILYYFMIFISCDWFKDNQNQSSQKFWISKYQKLNMLKKLFFISILVLFQKSPLIQTILLSMITQYSLVYLYYFTPIKKQEEYFFNFYSEISTFIFTLTSIFYCNEMNGILDNQDLNLLGWFHISLLLSVLLVNLCFQLYLILILIKKLIYSMLKHQRKKIQEVDPYPLIKA